MSPEDSVGVQKLRQLDRQIEEVESRLMPSFPQTIGKLSGFKRHKIKVGECLSWDCPRPRMLGLDTSAAVFFNSRGSEFDEHSHEQTETILVIEGSLLLTMASLPNAAIECGEEHEYLIGQGQIIPPHTLHFARFDEDCWYYAILIPSDRGRHWPFTETERG